MSHRPPFPRVALAASVVFLAAAAASGDAIAQTSRQKQAAPGQPARAAPARAVDDRHWQELADQAEAGLAKGDFSKAEQVARQLVEEALRIFGEAHANTAASRSILGWALFREGRYGAAEAEFRLSVNIYEGRSGPDSVNTASALNNLALVLEKLGDFSGAEVLLRRSLQILQKTLGPDHPDTATTLSNLGRVLDSQGKLGAAAALSAGPATSRPGALDNPDALAARVDELIAKGEYLEAESLQQRVVAIHEKTLGPENPVTATSISNLGNVLHLQGRFAEAEKIHRRALATREKVLGPDHPDVATSLNNLANTLLEQGKDEQLAPSEARARSRAGGQVFTETENLFRRAMNIQERALGAEHPALANTMNNLGSLLDQRGRFQDSEPLERHALAIFEKSLGSLHPDAAAALTSLAVSLDRQGKIVEAEQTYLKAVETTRRAQNPRILLLNTSRLGFSLAKRGRYREALPFYRESVETLDFLYVRTRGLSEETRQAFLGRFSNIYLETIKVLLHLHRANPKEGFDRQVLEIASRNQSRIFTEMMRQADVARFSDEPAFTSLRGGRDALQERIDGLRQAIVTVPVDRPDAEARRADLALRLASANRELVAIEDSLWKQYPRFMELTNPRPVSADDLQSKLLGPGEAVLSYVLLPTETVVFAVTRDRFKMAESAVKRDDIARRIHGIRRTIEKVTSGDSVLFLREIDPDSLHSLYNDLVAPVADVLQGSQKVIVIGDGPLYTVPFEFFVARWGNEDQQSFRATRARSDGSAPRPFLGEYAALDYIGNSYRFAYLPSLSALTSQRLYPKNQVKHARDLIAFADPVFDAGEGKTFSPATRAVLDALGNAVPRAQDGTPFIPRLKETADEAREIAATLGGSAELFVGQDAQERRAKGGDLKRARFVLFATHGFLGGEFLPATDAPEGALTTVVARSRQKTGAQPALALTLVGDLQGEDGILTMKEVIEDVELNADLVALSACNTAGETAEANNGEGFAGLTRAFMYSGARSLLVSHWSVDSLSTQALMTSTFRNIRAGQPVIQAINEARRAIVQGKYSSGPYNFSRGHPFFWAPFVYVGD